MEAPGPIIEDYCGQLTNQRSVLRPVDQSEVSIQHYLVRLPELQLELVTRDTLVGLEPSRELLPEYQGFLNFDIDICAFTLEYSQ